MLSFDTGITLPSSYSGWSFSTKAGPISGASFSTSSGSLKISNIFNYYYYADTVYEFSVTGWTNPSSASTVTFTIYTYQTTDGDYIIDEFTGLTIQPASGTINVQNVYPTDITRIYTFPTSYTF